MSFAVIEAVLGHLSGSLTLVSDAVHMASDTLALCLAAFAAWLANKPASKQLTFGYNRVEVIAALISAILLIMVSLNIITTAMQRLVNPEPIVSTMVMFAAAIGCAVNITIAWLLSKSEQTVNIRAAMLHVLGDIFGSFAALSSGIFIHFTNWLTIDPILSTIISVVIIISSCRLIREVLAILMQRTPAHIDIEHLTQAMQAMPGVSSIHDLHVWTLASDRTMLSCHVVIASMELWQHIAADIRKLLNKRYNIQHITLQPEVARPIDNNQEVIATCYCPHNSPTKENQHGCHRHD